MSDEMRGVLARVEAAKGPDRGLDVDLCVHFQFVHLVRDGTIEASDVRPAEDDFGWIDYEDEKGGCTDEAAPLTASIDAAVALVEKVLPEWIVEAMGQSHSGWWCQMRRSDGEDALISDAPTAPLAILAALLRALLAQAEQEVE